MSISMIRKETLFDVRIAIPVLKLLNENAEKGIRFHQSTFPFTEIATFGQEIRL
jgi:hypothetical protein